MEIKNFEQLVQQRQSCRDYLEQPVEKEKLVRLAEIGRLTPSACNSQPWKMYFVSGQKAKEVAPCLQDMGMNKFASKAPTFIVITETGATLKPGADRKFSSDHFVKYDVGQLVAYLTLEAKALGLDTCIIGWVNGEKLRAVVEYPETELCNIVIALGYSQAPLREKVRKPLETVTSFIE